MCKIQCHTSLCRWREISHESYKRKQYFIFSQNGKYVPHKKSRQEHSDLTSVKNALQFWPWTLIRLNPHAKVAKESHKPTRNLTPSLPWCHLKTTNNSVKFQTLKPFSFLFFAPACERINMKTQNIESRCYRTGKYTVCRRVHASFSPEILQAGAVKGLITKGTALACAVGNWI